MGSSSKDGIAAALLTIHRMLGDETRVMLLEGLGTMDRPAALGYFVLCAMVEAQRKDGMLSKVTLQLGHVDARKLAQHAQSEVVGGPMDGLQSSSPTVYTPRMSGTEYGELYRLTAGVSRGDKGLLSS